MKKNNRFIQVMISITPVAFIEMQGVSQGPIPSLADQVLI